MCLAVCIWRNSRRNQQKKVNTLPCKFFTTTFFC